MKLTNDVHPIIAQSLDVTDILAPLTFYELNPGGIEYPCFFLRIVNDTNFNFDISYDGINFHDYVLANSSLELNLQFNNQIPSNIANKARYGVVYVQTALIPPKPLGTVVLTGFTSYT